MAKAKAATKPVHPPTTLRLDPDLVFRAKKLALENRRDGRPEETFGQVMNAALAEYLKKRSA